MNRAKQCPQGVISREALISYEMFIRLNTNAIFHTPVTGSLTPTQKQRKLQYHVPVRAKQCPQGVISREALISYEMLIRLNTYAIFHAPVTVFPYPNPQKTKKITVPPPKTSVSCNFSPSWLPRNNISCIKVWWKRHQKGNSLLSDIPILRQSWPKVLGTLHIQTR